MRYHPVSYAEVLTVARASVSALERLGFRCAFVGGVACRLYGNSRDPNDVDVVILDARNHTQEELKRRLVQYDPNFYLIPSKDPFATYRVLWYRFSIYHSCKVDLLLPGVMNIPPVDSARIHHINGLPVMPFSIVLLLKLQAWADHRSAVKFYLQSKQFTDVADIICLLPIAKARNLRPRNEQWLPASFIAAAEGRVKSFVSLNPSTRDEWIALGFDVPKPPTVSRAGASSLYSTSRTSTARRTYSSASDRIWGWRDTQSILYDSD